MFGMEISFEVARTAMDCKRQRRKFNDKVMYYYILLD